MQSWKTLSRRTLIKQNKFLTVEEHTIQLPDGEIIPDWGWVVTPDFANVVVITEDGRYLCFRQVKYAVDGETLAVAGGYIEPGEDPMQAAQRELLEETGYEAKEWALLGSWPVDANRGAGIAYAFLAKGACRVAERNADDLEEQELVLLTREEITKALLDGEFKALPWSNTVAVALLYDRD